ncbi:YciI family protein [Streptomyces sp. NPDC096046]|uniref:YciI family protein n=1 Tax=Streptomyces sp. NPDC096046 TaxID=3155542 RepID=UPI003330B471
MVGSSSAPGHSSAHRLGPAAPRAGRATAPARGALQLGRTSIRSALQDGAPAVTDGPYLETKEYIASFYLLDCESLERAQQVAADMPFADVEPVELWPVLHESAADM